MTDQAQQAERRWADAMFANLQHQIYDLTAQVAALTHLIHAHTMAALNPPLAPPDDQHA